MRYLLARCSTMVSMPAFGVSLASLLVLAVSAVLATQPLTDEASDAMLRTLPIVPFAMAERQSKALALKSQDTGESELRFELLTDLLSSSVRAELTATGSPAKALSDAIPFLIDYPYGCVEQTMSRFYPLAIAADALRGLGIAPEELKQLSEVKPRGGLRSPDIGSHTLLDSAEIERIAGLGLQRLYRFQHQDGGWGWWENDSSDPYMTAYVLVGLHTAKKAGIAVRDDAVDRGPGTWTARHQSLQAPSFEVPGEPPASEPDDRLPTARRHDPSRARGDRHSANLSTHPTRYWW